MNLLEDRTCYKIKIFIFINNHKLTSIPSRIKDKYVCKNSPKAKKQKLNERK